MKKTLYYIVTQTIKDILEAPIIRFKGFLGKSNPNTLEYLKQGDLVEDTKGRKGRVFKIWLDKDTNKPRYCSVVWGIYTDPTIEIDSENLTLLAPVIDMGSKFNPEIRKIPHLPSKISA